jgi:glucose-6-phosphate 1-epimerase
MTTSASTWPTGVTRFAGAGGLETIRIDTPVCSGEILTYGAHVCAWKPQGAAPVIWMSRRSWHESGRPVRGGIPICFPWFGPHGSDPAAPPHGFARLRTWGIDAVESLADGAIAVALSLHSDAATRQVWPHEFQLRYRVVFGRTLTMQLAVRNTSAAPFTVQEALHTYFAVGDIRDIAIDGLAGVRYVDKLQGGERCVQRSEPIRFSGETDRPYLDTEATVTIVDARLGRRIVIAKRGSRTTVVWNPWIAKAKAMPDFDDEEWPSMVCVETANALDNAITLPPGSEHTMEAAIRVE